MGISVASDGEFLKYSPIVSAELKHKSANTAIIIETGHDEVENVYIMRKPAKKYSVT